MIDPFTALTSKIFGSVAIALGIVVAMQSCTIDRIEGERDKARQLAADEKSAHVQTVSNYRAAAVEAARVQTANLVRVRAEQERISDEVTASFDSRLADARRRILRAESAAADPGRAGATSVPGTGDAADRADETPIDLLSPSERLIAAEQAIQLDELISWVERQALVATSPMVASN